MKITEINFSINIKKRDYSHTQESIRMLFVKTITRDHEKSNPPEKGGLLFSFFCPHKMRARYATIIISPLDNPRHYQF